MTTGVKAQLRRAIPILLALMLTSCNTVDTPTSAKIDPSYSHTAGSFVWHDLITHDIQAAQRFYSGLFGWQFEQGEDREGNPYMLAKIEDHYTAGILEVDRPADGSNYTRWLGYMAVDQLDQALAITRSSGGKVVTGIEERGEIGRVSAIEDAQQAVLGLMESDFNTSGLVLEKAPGAVVWNELLASDSQAAASFYAELSGATAHTLQRRGGEYTMLRSGSSDLAGIFDNPFKSAAPLWLTYIAVIDPADAVARAESLGGKVLLAPSGDLREGSMALIQDPDGAILALQKWPL